MKKLREPYEEFLQEFDLESFAEGLDSFICKSLEAAYSQLEKLFQELEPGLSAWSLEQMRSLVSLQCAVKGVDQTLEEIYTAFGIELKTVQHCRLRNITAALFFARRATVYLEHSYHYKALDQLQQAILNIGRAQSYDTEWIASLRGRANKAKADKRFEPMRQRAIAMWEQANPKTGRPWKSYSACARYCVQDGGIEQDQNTVAKWIGDFERKRKQKRRPVPPAKNPVN